MLKVISVQIKMKEKTHFTEFGYPSSTGCLSKPDVKYNAKQFSLIRFYCMSTEPPVLVMERMTL